MKRISVILSCKGIGDILSSIPSIRYLHNIYNYNIPVFTHNVELFKNFPYIDVYDFSEHEKYKDEFEIISTFQIGNNVHTIVDIRQLHARALKIELLPSEMQLEYYPDEYINIDELPENYLVIHPSKTWPSRTWNEHQWQKLVDMLNNKNINVVIIGKDSGEHGTFNIQKPVFNINNGLNLVNKLNIDQTWHVLNKSKMVVTMDSGILHLAGTTDAYIVQLGSSINPRFRTPYRNGRQDYKCSYVLGECELFCASDLKYAIKYNGRYDVMPPVPFCLENLETIGNESNIDANIYKCHPSVEKVFNEIFQIYNYL